MNEVEINENIDHLLKNLPESWLRLTTHRIDKFNEKLAKVEFLDEFKKLNKASMAEYEDLPTAFDYIRLGHPLSCVLEFKIAQRFSVDANQVIAFASKSMPLLALLRHNKFKNIKTRVLVENSISDMFHLDLLADIYEYQFEILYVDSFNDVSSFDGDTVAVTKEGQVRSENVDFMLTVCGELGSVLILFKENVQDYIKEVLHVRRRESIAMTPHNCLSLLKDMSAMTETTSKESTNSHELLNTIKDITATSGRPLLTNCGLTSQYAIMMGLVHFSKKHNQNRKIHLIVPPNCYGGTNDQARRVAACIENTEVVDLAVDAGKNMVTELEKILEHTAIQDAVPYIIAEIPTNPRVEVPDLKGLQEVLLKVRKNGNGESAVRPVFILDQTFCPNVKFLEKDGCFSGVQTITYVSASKFPSGGLCTAGYIAANTEAEEYMELISEHLKITDNGINHFQLKHLTEQMPEMNNRIKAAFENTDEFVKHIKYILPNAKINFVSEDLVKQGFTPSVFSLDLPTVGDTPQEKENFKREMNLRLINMMIRDIPNEAKYCVSYGQLKGCYFTVPATSTQGTTKEGDKDYIVRVSCSGIMTIALFKEVFSQFVNEVYK